MGEALRKLRTAGREVQVDLNAPALTIARSDRHAFAIHPDSARCEACDPEKGPRGICEEHYQPTLAKARCVRMLIHTVVRGACGEQLGRADGKVYAAVLEALDAVDDGDTTLTLTLDAVRWLSKQAGKEEAKIAAGLAQWREAWSDYLEAIIRIAEQEAPTA